jgi:hypothetical protein
VSTPSWRDTSEILIVTFGEVLKGQLTRPDEAPVLLGQGGWTMEDIFRRSDWMNKRTPWLPTLAAVVMGLGVSLAAHAQKVKLATSMGDIVIELDAAKAPKTVDNFASTTARSSIA